MGEVYNPLLPKIINLNTNYDRNHILGSTRLIKMYCPIFPVFYPQLMMFWAPHACMWLVTQQFYLFLGLLKQNICSYPKQWLAASKHLTFWAIFFKISSHAQSCVLKCIKCTLYSGHVIILVIPNDQMYSYVWCKCLKYFQMKNQSYNEWVRIM